MTSSIVMPILYLVLTLVPRTVYPCRHINKRLTVNTAHDKACLCCSAAPYTGVGPEFLGRVKLGSNIASLAGVWIFQSFLKQKKISTVLFWTALASVPLGFTQVSPYPGSL